MILDSSQDAETLPGLTVPNGVSGILVATGTGYVNSLKHSFPPAMLGGLGLVQNCSLLVVVWSYSP